MVEKTEYVIRKESAVANTYGLGEVILPGIALFRAGNYGLNKEELEAAIKRTGHKENSNGSDGR